MCGSQVPRGKRGAEGGVEGGLGGLQCSWGGGPGADKGAQARREVQEAGAAEPGLPAACPGPCAGSGGAHGAGGARGPAAIRPARAAIK